MKRKLFFSTVAITFLMISCNNGDTSDEYKDSANTLQDTFPANGLKDSIPVDSNPADNTYVDSLNKTQH